MGKVTSRRISGKRAVAFLITGALFFPSLASPHSDRADLSPGLFEKVSSGVAYVTTYTCGGSQVGQGSGFLIGSSVVMTARHVVRGACRIRVKVDGVVHDVVSSSYWRGSSRGSGSAEDVATLKLEGSSEGHLFVIRSDSPPAGANLAMVGHPLGNRVSLNQGKIIQKVRVGGVPLIAVQMLGAEGASGSAFLDDAARVVGILQIGLGSEDILGQRTAGVVLGIDLSRVSAQIRRNLCTAYPNGGIAGCTKGPVRRDKPPRPQPTPVPPPPAAPAQLAITECWVTTSESFEPSAKIFSLAPARQSIYAVLQLNRTAAASELVNFSVKLQRPDGSLYADSPYEQTGQAFGRWKVRIDLKGRGQTAPLAGDWRLSMALGSASPCTFGVRVEKGTQLSLTPSRTTFDPYYTYSLTLSWSLLQDIEVGAGLSARLVGPNGNVISTSTLLLSDYTTSGTEYLITSSCFRSSFSSVDTCTYGTYRIEIVKNGQALASVSIDAVKP